MERLVGGLILLMLCVGVVGAGGALAEADLPPGAVEGTGTHFAVTDSAYLNVTLDSSEVIDLKLQSFPEMIAIHLASAAGETEAAIVLGGMAPDTTYYKYEDDYHHLATLTTDATGACAYTQDLTCPHAIFIQPSASTWFIRDDATGGDATLIGTWDPATKTCTMTMDVNGTIQIDSDGITLDGNGHKTTGTKTGAGVHISDHSSVTVKNLTVDLYGYGVYTMNAPGFTLEANTLTRNAYGLSMCDGTDFATISGNTVDMSVLMSATMGLDCMNSTNAVVSDNTITGSGSSNALRLYYMTDSAVTGNTVSGKWAAGIQLFYSNGSTVAENSASGCKSGIYLRNTTGSTVSHNTLTANSVGLYWDQAADDAVFNNKFIGNSTQARGYSSSGTLFNLPLPQGGNYWSDWTSPDTDGDGFVDLPYVFMGGQDDLPWTVPDAWPPLGGNTQPGANVTVEPGEGVSLTFSEVTAAGETTVTTSDTPPHGPPSGFRFLGQYFNIETTAEYVAPITICIPYDPADVPGGKEWKIRLFHFEPGAGWQNVTVMVDTENHLVVGQVSSLSWFAAATPLYQFEGFLPPIEGRDKPFKRGSTIPVKFRISDELGAPVTDAVCTLKIYYLESGAPAGEAEVVSTAAGDWGNQFRCGADGNLYIFNLSTKDPSFVGYYTYLAEAALDDGSTHTAPFSLK